MSLKASILIALIGFIGTLIYMNVPSSIPDVTNSQDENEITICVIGSGLAGISAALGAHDEAIHLGLLPKGLRVMVIEKEVRLGGNSAKASSGINALNLPGGDSMELFTKDTLTSGGGLSDKGLVETLVSRSPEAISFLANRGVDLSSVTLLGGHSVPRSFGPGSGPNVGSTIMQCLIKQAEELTSIVIRGGTKLLSIALEQGRVVGIRVSKVGEKGEGECIACAAVVLATGGFAANRTLLETHSPFAADLATTNGPWAQGEGLAIALAAGADIIHMEHVQIHPTGIVDPNDPGASTKWLAPEKLRGDGALLINSEGKRFVNELATRDVVSEAMLKLPGKRATLLLGSASSKAFGVKTLDLYVSRGVMTRAESLHDLALDANLPMVRRRAQEVLLATITLYNVAAEDGSDDLGKRFFPHKVAPEGPFYVAQVVPVVHYTMGGIKIDGQARALDGKGRPIPGLYAAGEVSGGVHGRNRLGGNSLLECVVFGSIAGKNAVKSSVSSRL